MLTDGIIEKVRANREAHAKKFNYNLRAIYEDLKKSEKSAYSKGIYPLSQPPKLPTTI